MCGPPEQGRRAMPISKKSTQPMESPLVWGARQIAEVIGRTERQTHHLLETGALPARKVGGRWVANVSRLIAHCSDPED